VYVATNSSPAKLWRAKPFPAKGIDAEKEWHHQDIVVVLMSRLLNLVHLVRVLYSLFQIEVIFEELD
jgi:hypothetical protein